MRLSIRTKVQLFVFTLLLFICTVNIIVYRRVHTIIALYDKNYWYDHDYDLEQRMNSFRNDYLNEGKDKSVGSRGASIVDSSTVGEYAIIIKDSTIVNGNKKASVENSKDSYKYSYNEYNATEYKGRVHQSMRPIKNVATGAWIYGFWGGFCNQYFTFLGIVFLSNEVPNLNLNSDGAMIMSTSMSEKQKGEEKFHSHSHPTPSNQIYIHSLQWKDLYGTNEKLRHEILFDVPHWNSYYPTLPKLVASTSSSAPSDNNNRESNNAIFPDLYVHYDERGSDVSVVATLDKMEEKFGAAPRLIWNATVTTTATSTSTSTIHSSTDEKNKNRNNNHDKMRYATNPYPIGFDNSSQIANNRYKQFSKWLYNYHQEQRKRRQDKIDIDIGIDRQNRQEMEQYELIMRDALRPHPELQYIIQNFTQSSLLENKSNGNDSNAAQWDSSSSSNLSPPSYMVLHARIEPDMQHHPVCKTKKVVNITNIINGMYETFPEPPASTLIILLNKQLLEDEVRSGSSTFSKNKNDSDNLNKSAEIAKYNLQVVDNMLQSGLWNGRVKVIEAGSKLALESNHDVYSRYPVIVGGIINFFLSIEATVFIGTEVSSYSTSIVNSRFYRKGNGLNTSEGEEKSNYFYVPNGLYLKDSIHWFRC